MTKGEQARLTAWRWKVLQQAADELNVARVCRHFGISRKSFYKWKRRHADHGAAGLCDRPRTPHRSPRATSRDVIRKILYLRQQYHFGPGRIAMYLHRFHQILVARSSVHRILKRDSNPKDLRRVQPARCHPIYRRGAAAFAISRACRADRQRRRIPIPVPLAPGESRRSALLHSAPHTTLERQSGAVAPRRRPGVLPVARSRWHQRRHPSVQPESA
jgi:transposase